MFSDLCQTVLRKSNSTKVCGASAPPPTPPPRAESPQVDQLSDDVYRYMLETLRDNILEIMSYMSEVIEKIHIDGKSMYIYPAEPYKNIIEGPQIPVGGYTYIKITLFKENMSGVLRVILSVHIEKTDYLPERLMCFHFWRHTLLSIDHHLDYKTEDEPIENMCIECRRKYIEFLKQQPSLRRGEVARNNKCAIGTCFYENKKNDIINYVGFKVFNAKYDSRYKIKMDDTKKLGETIYEIIVCNLPIATVEKSVKTMRDFKSAAGAPVEDNN
jgi:hypothetical protein